MLAFRRYTLKKPKEFFFDQLFYIFLAELEVNYQFEISLKKLTPAVLQEKNK